VVAAAAVLILISATVNLARSRLGSDRLSRANPNLRIFSDRAALAPMLSRDAGARLIDLDDGIFGFALEGGALSGLGLCLDAEAAAARRRGALLDLAHDRGYRRIAVARYVDLRRIGRDAASEEIERLLWVLPVDGDRFELEIEHLAADRSYAILGFRRRAAERSPR
jgi:hypothetical protein